MPGTTVDLAANLIERKSVTPDDAGCQPFIASRLTPLGFQATHLRFEEVDNLWISHGEGEPVFTFLGHTDVVPAGPAEKWQSDPFTAQTRGAYLYGRGAADMKGSIAAMVTAMERFVDGNPDHPGTLGMLLTSDEEGDAVNGTVRVMEYLAGEKIHIDWCLVGEPSCTDTLGDTVKNGRRGSLGATLTVHGIQGHVAYPDLARNPVHMAAPAITELCSTQWDRGNENYPPTSFQISNIRAGDGTVNVIPGQLELMCNFRFSTEVTAEELMRRTEAVLSRHGVDYSIDWRTSGLPFLTQRGPLLDAVRESTRDCTGREPRLSTAGGTSDGRFVAPCGAEVVELGPVNRSIHKVDEHVRLEDLDVLADIYLQVLQKLLV